MPTIMTKDEILKKLNIADIDHKLQQLLLENVASVVQAKIFNEVYSRLSDEDIDKLEKLTAKNDAGAIEWFLKSKFEHYDDFVLATESATIDEMASELEALSDQEKDNG